MSSPPQPRNDFTFPWSVDHDPQSPLIEKLEQFYRLCRARWQFLETYRRATEPGMRRLGQALDQTLLATALIVLPKALAGWETLRPVIRAHTRALLPFIPQTTPEEEAVAQDPAWEILAEFESLAPDQRDKAAQNLALLWDHFEKTFGGLSGFLAEPQTEQSLYLDKLMTASRRMKLARGSEVAFHFVTVELMRLYVEGLWHGRRDRAAFSLASTVSVLIDRGRMMRPALTFEGSASSQRAEAA
ncbi:hypothetical protein [Microvirga zambiensis]|uniref:hypothetical protein n=1 Tax=Microvirga zambiensis TaxID=1402137 RepID=UPI00191F6109|nr:hypothetical protein [Microvirga zambiensis]